MINPNTLELTQEVRYAPESASANALRVMEIVREKKAKIKNVRLRIKSSIDSDRQYVEAVRLAREAKKKAETRKADLVATVCKDDDHRLRTLKSELEAEQLALSGWIGEHVKETGQLSLFDAINNEVHQIKVAYKVK